MATNLKKVKPVKNVKQETLYINILLAFSIVFVFVVLLGKVNALYRDYSQTAVVHNFLLNFRWIALGVSALFLIVTLLCSRKSKNATFIFGHFSAVAFIAFFFSWYISRYLANQATITLSYILIPAIALVYMFYFIFQREFFLLSVFVSTSSFGLWLLYRLMINANRTVSKPVAAIVFIALVVLSALAIHLIRKNDGVLSLFGKKIKVFHHGTNYQVFFIACALLVAIVILALIFGASFAWYGVMVMIVYLFLMAVYYTIHLM